MTFSGSFSSNIQVVRPGAVRICQEIQITDHSVLRTLLYILECHDCNADRQIVFYSLPSIDNDSTSSNHLKRLASWLHQSRAYRFSRVADRSRLKILSKRSTDLQSDRLAYLFLLRMIITASLT